MSSPASLQHLYLYAMYFSKSWCVCVIVLVCVCLDSGSWSADFLGSWGWPPLWSVLQTSSPGVAAGGYNSQAGLGSHVSDVSAKRKNSLANKEGYFPRDSHPSSWCPWFLYYHQWNVKKLVGLKCCNFPLLRSASISMLWLTMFEIEHCSWLKSLRLIVWIYRTVSNKVTPFIVCQETFRV